MIQINKILRLDCGLNVRVAHASDASTFRAKFIDFDMDGVWSSWDGSCICIDLDMNNNNGFGINLIHMDQDGHK